MQCSKISNLRIFALELCKLRSYPILNSGVFNLLLHPTQKAPRRKRHRSEDAMQKTISDKSFMTKCLVYNLISVYNSLYGILDSKFKARKNIFLSNFVGLST